MAAERKPHLPCRIEHPDPTEDVFHAPLYGAPVTKAETFRILFSDGQWFTP